MSPFWITVLSLVTPFTNLTALSDPCDSLFQNNPIFKESYLQAVLLQKEEESRFKMSYEYLKDNHEDGDENEGDFLIEKKTKIVIQGLANEIETALSTDLPIESLLTKFIDLTVLPQNWTGSGAEKNKNLKIFRDFLSRSRDKKLDEKLAFSLIKPIVSIGTRRYSPINGNMENEYLRNFAGRFFLQDLLPKVTLRDNVELFETLEVEFSMKIAGDIVFVPEVHRSFFYFLYSKAIGNWNKVADAFIKYNDLWANFDEHPVDAYLRNPFFNFSEIEDPTASELIKYIEERRYSGGINTGNYNLIMLGVNQYYIDRKLTDNTSDSNFDFLNLYPRKNFFPLAKKYEDHLVKFNPNSNSRKPGTVDLRNLLTTFHFKDIISFKKQLALLDKASIDSRHNDKKEPDWILLLNLFIERIGITEESMPFVLAYIEQLSEHMGNPDSLMAFRTFTEISRELKQCEGNHCLSLADKVIEVTINHKRAFAAQFLLQLANNNPLYASIIKPSSKFRLRVISFFGRVELSDEEMWHEWRMNDETNRIWESAGPGGYK